MMPNPPYPIEFFTASAMVAFSMISQVLGLETTLVIRDIHLEALFYLVSLCEEDDKPHLNFCETISDIMYQELSGFLTRRRFRHQAYLVHLFLHQQHSYMERFNLNLVGTDHQLRPVIEWCPKIRNTSGKENLPWFIDEFMSTLYFLLHDVPLSRVIQEMIQELQPASQPPSGD